MNPQSAPDRPPEAGSAVRAGSAYTLAACVVCGRLIRQRGDGTTGHHASVPAWRAPHPDQPANLVWCPGYRRPPLRGSELVIEEIAPDLVKVTGPGLTRTPVQGSP